MVKPTKRKFQCNKCSEERWVESFGGYKYSELDESSVCEYCVIRSEYRGEIAALRGLVTSMQSDMEALRRQLDGQKRECKCTHLDTPVSSKVTLEDAGEAASGTEPPPPSSKKKKPKKKKKKTSSEEKIDEEEKPEKVEVQEKNKVKKAKTKVKKNRKKEEKSETKKELKTTDSKKPEEPRLTVHVVGDS